MNADKAKQEINALIDAALDAMPPSGRESTEIDIHVPIRALREVLDALPKQPTSDDRDELRVVITKVLYGLSETAQVVTDAVIDWMSARRSSQLAVEHNDDLAMVLYDLAGGAIDYHGATILANRARIHIGAAAQLGGES